MQNKNNILTWLSAVICSLSFLFLAYVFANPTHFNVKNALFIVPKLATTEEFSTSKIKKYNEDKFNATFEIPDVSIVKSNNKNLESKILATNEVYPFIYKVPILTGGFFTLEHLNINSKVAVLNKTAAFNFFGSPDCIDEQVGFNNTNYTIVGVIDDGDDKNNTVYYPSGYTDKNPKNLMISFKDASVDEVLASLNILGVSKDNYYIINLDNVVTLLQNKAFFALDVFIFVIGFNLIGLLIKKIISQFKYIKELLITDYYLSQLIFKKFLLIIYILFNICLTLATSYYLLTIANRYVVYSMKLKVDWLFIKKANSFEFMTDVFYKLNNTTTIAWVIFIITIIYTLVLYYSFKIKNELQRGNYNEEIN